MEAGGVIEGLPTRVGDAGELEPPERVERADAVLSSLGAAEPIAGGITAAASLALCQAFGLADIGAHGGLDLAFGAVVAAALATRRVIRSRDHLHDRMRWALEMPEGAEVGEAPPGGRALVARSAWFVVRWTAFIVGAVAVLQWIDSDLDRWPLVIAATLLGSCVGNALRLRQVRRHEEEHGVELFLDADREAGEDDRPAGDFGRMFQRPSE